MSWQDAQAARADVVVVGAGVVGLFSALELARSGRSVCVLERGPLDGGCATGSAGFICISHVMPLVDAGAWREGLRGIFDRRSAVSLRPALSNVPFVIRLLRASNEANATGALPSMTALARLTDELWRAWLADLTPDFTAPNELIDAYGDADALATAAEHAERLRAHGIASRVLDRAQTLAAEPALLPDGIVGGVAFPGDYGTHPTRTLAALIERARAEGVVLVPETEVLDFTTAGRSVTGLQTTRGDLRCAQLVLAPGALAEPLAKRLGLRVPMRPARGMSITIKRPANAPRGPLTLGERHVAVAPMDDELRISTWFDIGEYSTSPDPRRLALMLELARSRIALPDEPEIVRRWAGLRPFSPDDVPVIGRPARWDDVVIAAGHGMTGLTLGPATGRVVAQLVCGERPAVDLARFSPDRWR